MENDLRRWMRLVEGDDWASQQRERTKKVHEDRDPLIAEHTQPFDDDDSTYKSGYCYAFAFAVNKLTGWPMYALRRKYDRSSETLHVFNEMPDRQRVFDCHGITDWASMEQNYDAMDPKVWSERWDESDIRLAIRRRDLMKMPRTLVRNAMADAAAVLRDENIEVPISVASVLSRQRPPNDALFYTPKRRFAPTT